LPGKLLISITERLGRDFRLTDDEDRDYSMEIDPRSVEQGTLSLLASLGFNRISLGVQDFDERVQRAVNRVQPAAMVAKVYEAARRLEFRSINFDLIYGLPMQTVASFGATLDRVVALRPDRLAVYGYAHIPRLFKAQRQIRNDELPNASDRLSLLQLAVNKLGEAGYEYIGMDHFALAGDSLAQARKNRTLHRSFQGYTTHADRDLVSFGVSAIGRVGDLYVQNHKLPRAYEAALANNTLPSNRGIAMNRDDHIRKEIIDGIMCQGYVELAAIEAHHGIDFGQYFAREQAQLHTLRADGLIDLEGGFIALTAVGRLLMRTVAMTFDAYSSVALPAAMSRVI
jgi:oxygen-independent coproporphyrinogen-3 oxidase